MPPGLHNADHLVILASDDGKHGLRATRTRASRSAASPDGKPLVVDFGRTGRPAGMGR